MNTPTHLILAAAIFAKPGQRKVTTAALLGGFIPDFSLYFMFFWHRFVLNTSTNEIFDVLYFSDYWQKVFAIDNSFIVWGMLLGFAKWHKSKWMIALTGAAFIHLMCDFPLHVDDARAHFWPFTMWKFESPVSYWDRNHHGSIFSVFEILLVCVLLGILWRRFETLLPRIITLAAAALTIAPFVVFNLIMGFGS
jgi:hypothetical protein